MLGHRPICVHDDALHAGQAHVQQLCDQVELIDVDEQEPILGLVNRELLLPRRKPQVDRMQHGLDPRHCEVRLQMAVGVPGEAAHTLARRESELLQGVAEAP